MYCRPNRVTNGVKVHGLVIKDLQYTNDVDLLAEKDVELRYLRRRPTTRQ